MYLHQQLVDNFILLNKNKLRKLQNKYSYTVTKIGKIEDIWYNYIIKPNTITKLRYQYSYYYGYSNYFPAYIKWNYISGCIGCLQQMLYFAAEYNNITLFDFCLHNGAIPDNSVIDNAVYGGSIEIFNKCIELGVKPNQETLYESINDECDDEAVLFKECLKFGLVPDNVCMCKASFYCQTEIFKICLEYGNIPDINDIINIIDNNCYPDILKIVIDTGIDPEDDVINEIIEYHKARYSNIEMPELLKKYLKLNK